MAKENNKVDFKKELTLITPSNMHGFVNVLISKIETLENRIKILETPAKVTPGVDKKTKNKTNK